MERLSKITVAILAALLLTYAVASTNNRFVLAESDGGSDSGSDGGNGDSGSGDNGNGDSGSGSDNGGDSGSNDNNGDNNGDNGNGDNNNDNAGDQPQTPDQNSGQAEVVTPNVVQDPIPGPSTGDTPVPPASTPKCDGSKQDCITRNGDFCKAGEGGEKCECAPDNSDCSKNPSIEKPVTPAAPITPTPGTPDKSCAFNPDSPKCHPDKDGNCPAHFAHNVHGNCFPEGKCPSDFARKDGDESGTCFPKHSPGDFCHFHKCPGLPPHHPPTHTIVKVIHQTKVIHKSALHSIVTVFVPGIGLVEPFNCKLNENNGKIGCEFIVVKVIN